MSTIEFGLKTRGGNKSTKTAKAIPLGVVIVFKDLDTGKVEIIHRLLIPDSFSLTAFQVIRCVKKLFTDEADSILQEILQTRTHAYVSVIFFSYNY